MSLAKCPFSHSQKQQKPVSNYIFQFEEPFKRSFFVNLYSNTHEYLSRFSYSSFRNAWYSYKKNDLSGLFSKVCKPGDFVSLFRSPIGTQYVFRNPAIMPLILSHYRNEENGLFHASENEKLFIDVIIRDLYPKELATISDREKEVVNSMIITAESAFVHPLRSCITGLLKPKNVNGMRDKIDKITNDILDQMTEDERKCFNPAHLIFEMAITVIAKLFLNYETTRENYQKVVMAMTTIGKKISDGITKQPESESEKQEYEIALQYMRDLLETNLISTPHSEVIIGLREYGLSDFSIKVYLFFFYLAGTETTSAVTHYLFLQLGMKKNSYLQEVIRNEGKESITLKKCITEALRLNPSAFILGRGLRKDIMLTARDSEKKLIWKKLLRKGHYIVVWVAGAGRDPSLYSNPERFDPMRFDTIPSILPWLPFTSGHHSCPGQFLARAEMESFVYEVVKRFQIVSMPDDCPIEQKGNFTLHADPDNKIRMRFDPVRI